MKLVTGNRHKLEEVRSVMEEFDIEVGHIDDEKYESKDMDLEEVARHNAEMFYNKYKEPVAVDDTGVFFDAYPDFPGNHPKLMFNLLGYKGLLKLVEGEKRGGKFVTVVGYCDEDGVKVFRGDLQCQISTEVHDPDKDVLPYERIFLLEGRPFSELSREEKNKVSHRAKAFRALGEHLEKFKKFT